MSRPCACFTSMYVQNLSAAHAFTVVWRLVYTFCRPSLAFYRACSLWGLGFAWLLAFPPSTHSFALFCNLCISCWAILPFLLWCYLTQDYWAFSGLLPILLSMTQYSHWAFWLLFLQAPVSHLFPFEHPWPIYFPWASSALSNFVFPWAFTNSFGCPWPNCFIIHSWAHRLSINSLLSLLALLRACCGPFSLFYITYCSWVCYFSLSGLL